MDELEKAHWVAFSHVKGIGPSRFQKLLSHFGSACNAWSASEKEMLLVLGERLTYEINQQKKKLQPEKLYREIVAREIQVLTLEDHNLYPPLLREISNSPYVLYCKGDFYFQDFKHFLAVIGTRKPTPYGLRAAHILSRSAAEKGIVIVSGLATGIDGEAHRGAIDADAPTIGVLGSGFDHLYPRIHKKLAQEILEKGGLLVSEYPPSTKPSKESFPQRNRIISGLSHGVLVVEAPIKSGTMITVDFALEQGREVLAVPGPIFSRTCEGSNLLIAQGAYPVVSVKSIYDFFQLPLETATREEHLEPASLAEENLLQLIPFDGIHKEELLLQSKLEESTFYKVLLALEIKGLIGESADGRLFRY
ncbi:MAG: processing protein [Candidatus Atribacteria bacterium]|jgi:DNA processing protein|nr:processing protein [Candidatus Atribacteria bacterium]